MKYVIIGNSTAGIGAAEGIRQIDNKGEIIIISKETYHTYSRPLISYLLLGKTDEQKMKYRHDDFYIKNNVTLISGKNVTKINENKKTIVLEDNDLISYDKLLVATGSSPFIPPLTGIDTVKSKFTFMTLDDAKSLNNALNKNARVLIIGAGLIGLKCAEGVFNKVKDVTVVDLAPKILSSILNDKGAEIIKSHLENIGIELRLSQSIKSFSTNTAIFDNGEKIDFDILVLAAGVRPNISLLQGIVKTDKGIIIDNKGNTSCSDIYAAGDCTQSYDISSGQYKIMALLPNAYMQGTCAGINMAGGNTVFNKGLPMNAISLFGLHIITAGDYTGENYIKEEGNNYKILFYSHNKLNGYILIGDVKKAGIYTNLIREGTPLDTIDFKLICRNPGLMAFSSADRKIKLGGYD